MKNETLKPAELSSGLRSLYGSYGYSLFRMRKFEEYDLYVRNKNFLLSDHIITFTEPSGKLMALRPDVTLSIVKNFKETPADVQKVYYKEKVYRIDRDSGSFREITQLGLECVGDIDTYQIYEVLSLALKSLRVAGGEFVLDISHLGIVSGLLSAVGLPEEYRAPLLTCLGEKNAHGAAAICREAGLSEAAGAQILGLITAYGAPEKVLPVLRAMPLDENGRAALAELEAVLAALGGEEEAGSIRLDFSVVNDMNYYNGIVFRGFLSGLPCGILSGGRYDYLVQKMEKCAGAIGFAVYPDLLEDLVGEQDAYDVDTVLLYDGGTDLLRLRAAVEEMRERGVSVLAQKCVPAKLRYRRLCRLGEDGVTEE